MLSVDPTLHCFLFLCVLPLINTDLLLLRSWLICLLLFFLENHTHFWWGKMFFFFFLLCFFVQRCSSIAQMDILENIFLFAEELNCTFVFCQPKLHKKCNACIKS